MDSKRMVAEDRIVVAVGSINRLYKSGIITKEEARNILRKLNLL